MATNNIYSDVDIGMNKQTDGDLQKDTEFNAIVNSVSNIINTMKGSRRMLPEFASNVYNLLFEPIDEDTARLLGEEMIDAIEYWDDRVDIVEAIVLPDYENNLYKCRLTVRVITTNETKNIDFILR